MKNGLKKYYNNIINGFNNIIIVVYSRIVCV